MRQNEISQCGAIVCSVNGLKFHEENVKLRLEFKRDLTKNKLIKQLFCSSSLK